MRKYQYAILLFIPILSSCLSSTEYKNKEKPTISDICYNIALATEDTLHISATNSIILNRNKDALVDTLIINRPIYINACFHGSNDLSSYYVSLDSIEYMPIDSVFRDKAYTSRKGFITMFEKKDVCVIKDLFTKTIPDSIPVTSGNLKTRTGLYKLRIRCIDVAGNASDSLAYSKNVEIFDRKALLQKLGY